MTIQAGARVLVVEDYPEEADEFREALDRAGYATERAEAVSDAIAKTAEFQPDVVLLDLSIPSSPGGTDETIEHGFQVPCSATDPFARSSSSPRTAMIVRSCAGSCSGPAVDSSSSRTRPTAARRWPRRSRPRLENSFLAGISILTYDDVIERAEELLHFLSLHRNGGRVG
jgi:hypothetical protein